MTFGMRLRELREDNDMTQKQLASIIGVSPRMVSFYENGEHFPRDESIILKLADHFGVSTDYLLGYSNIRSFEQLYRWNIAFDDLPETARKSAMDYLDFLHSKYRKNKK